MAVLNLGSINYDLACFVPRLPAPGETLAAREIRRGLGGKGANQSIAAARDGARVVHIGAVGADGAQALEALGAAGVDVTHVRRVDGATGHALIWVDEAGENAIVIAPAANARITPEQVAAALAAARPGDVFLAQNETSLVAEAAAQARAAGLRVIWSAAPFAAEVAAAVAPHADVVIVNEGEAQALRAAGIAPRAVLVTRGAKGARFEAAGEAVEVPAFPVRAVDTTGAGDTYAGVFAAGLDAGLEVAQAMRRAAAAAAIQVTRPGTAEAIPTRAEIDAFLAERG